MQRVQHQSFVRACSQLLNVFHAHLLKSIFISFLQISKLSLRVETHGANACQKAVHVVFLLLNAFLLVPLQVKVFGLGLSVPKFFKVHLSVLLHLLFVLLALIFEAVVYFSWYAYP